MYGGLELRPVPPAAGHPEGLPESGRDDLYARKLLRPGAEGGAAARFVAAPLPAGPRPVVEGAEGLLPDGLQARPPERDAPPFLGHDDQGAVGEPEVDPVHRLDDGPLPPL